MDDKKKLLVPTNLPWKSKKGFEIEIPFYWAIFLDPSVRHACQV